MRFTVFRKVDAPASYLGQPTFQWDVVATVSGVAAAVAIAGGLLLDRRVRGVCVLPAIPACDAMQPKEYEAPLPIQEVPA